MNRYPLFLLALVLMCTSCIKDELPNTECDITSAWVEGDEYAENFYEPSQMRLENISTTENELVFTVRSLISLPKSMPLYFNITPGATISPANGSPQDFTQGPVTYTVTSQDGSWKREYTVVFKEATLPTFTFSFENYETKESSSNYYHEFYEIDQAGMRQNIWASGNLGAILIKYNSQAEDQPTYSTPDGYKGRGVCLNTQYAGELGKAFGKPIAAGNLFIGRFILENVLIDALKATQFGRPIDRVPVRVTGYYKYQPGSVFTNKEMQEVPGRVDEASIYAVFYRNKDAQGNDVYLYGDDVLSSPYIVRKAQVATLPPTNEWTRFEMFFEGSDADEALLAAQGYNMTLVFSSSKDGASFEGAVGSVLYIDEVAISFDNDEN
ncbi:MAG: PCMD domain-containing protein [Muribaculaceae bacterium]|nr:PCMD domain-containing protein [Muribaculaceae bacterium]